MKEYYVYEMHEVLSQTGKPYVGSSKNFYGRARWHKWNHKLDKRPELIIIDGPYYSREEAKAAEQPYRVANGWKDENDIFREAKTKENQSKNGSIGAAIVGKMLWINNGIQNKRIDPSLLQDYLDIGYHKGQLRNKK
jgi:hypothetical protein